jgi:amino acid transporter
MAVRTTPKPKRRPPARGLVKRILVGRAIATEKREHQLLPKFLALPVFSSDPLSSVAYATEEMMLVLALAGAAALGYMLPIGFAIAVLLAIVVTSYRQTVRAYPQGGGSYIVSRENLGTLPGLTAAAAILTDYVLTVAVSVTAGTIAVTSAAPELAEHKVLIAVGFVTLITLANLRGVKEASTMFAVPTYGFVAMVYLTLLTGFVRCLDGCPTAASAELDLPAHQAITIFLLLRAFASGATALTGVEAIADGVQAFRRPHGRNAATTLAVMGSISISMFLGITFLARALEIRVREDVHGPSVLAQIGQTVFGPDSPLFYGLQAFTAGILILAANTAFQDFPRLSSILARDRFMPSQFRNLGDRLVFSNGVIVLAVLASLLIYAFDASLTRLIQLYIVGVFTAFTLSQAGMVRRWLRIREGTWKRSAVINGIGATVTGVVLVIVIATKFTHGAWIVITAMPLIILTFLAIHRHYTTMERELRRGRVTVGGIGLNHAVLLVDELDEGMVEAVGFVRSIRPTDVRALYIGGDEIPFELRDRWRRFAPGLPDLETLPAGTRDLLGGVRTFIRGIPCRRRDFITIVVPEVIREESLTGYLLRRRSLVRLKAGLLRERNVVVADVPVVAGVRVTESAAGRPLIPTRTVALVFVSAVHDATVRAVNYARSLEASETRAIYFDMDPDQERRLEEEWATSGLEIPLDIVEAPFRDLAGPMLEEVRRYTARPDTLVLVVVPELVLTKWRHLLLHNQNALFIKRLMLFEPQVVLASVPYSLELA